jgi:hypothetical protein
MMSFGLRLRKLDKGGADTSWLNRIIRIDNGLPKNSPMPSGCDSAGLPILYESFILLSSFCHKSGLCFARPKVDAGCFTREKKGGV